MAVDEYGREPGVDYSDQSWVVRGSQPERDKEVVDQLEAAAAAAAG